MMAKNGNSQKAGSAALFCAKCSEAGLVKCLHVAKFAGGVLHLTCADCGWETFTFDLCARQPRPFPEPSLN